MINSLPKRNLICLILTLLLIPVRHSSAGETGGEDKQSVSYGSQVLGKPPLTLDGRIWATQFTADSKALLTVTDKIDRIEWPSKNRRILWQPQHRTMNRATFSPDGTLFANSESGDNVHIHETATGKLLYTFQGCQFRSTAMAWSPDSKRLALGLYPEVVIFDLKTGTAVQKLALGNSDITRLAWSPDDKWIVAETEKPGEGGQSVVLRSLRDDSAPIFLPGNRNTRFSFSPDSKILAVATEKTKSAGTGTSVIYLWDLVAAKEIVSKKSYGYNSIVHSPDGKFLVVCGLDHLEILDAQTGAEVCRPDSDLIRDEVWSAAFSPDGKLLATGIGDRICFRDTTTWKEIDPDDVLRTTVSALAFSGDGRHLVTGGLNGDLVLWDWEKKAPVWKCFSPAKGGRIKALSIDPKAQWIGMVQTPSYYKNPHIRLVDFATGKTIRELQVPNLTDAAPLFHPSRRTAYLATRDHQLLEWDCESGESLRKIPIPFLRTIESGRYGTISSMEFDPTTPEIIRWHAGSQATGRIDVRNGVESCGVEARVGRPHSDPIPPREHDFAAIGSCVWNLPTFHEVTPAEYTDRPSVRHPSELLQFSASGHRVRCFDILSQSFIHSFEFGPGEIKAIALSPDGRTLIAASSGGLRYFSLEGPPLAEGTSPEVLWGLMGGENQWEAYQAAWALSRQPNYLRFLASHLAPAREPGAEELARLKERLGANNHVVRQIAAREWLDLGQEIDKETLQTLREGGLSEKSRGDVISKSVLLSGTDFSERISLLAPPAAPRINKPVVVSGIDPCGPVPLLTPLSAHCRAMRAVMLLKEDRSEASRQLLERLADGYAGAPLTKAAKKALASQR